MDIVSLKAMLSIIVVLLSGMGMGWWLKLFFSASREDELQERLVASNESLVKLQTEASAQKGRVSTLEQQLSQKNTVVELQQTRLADAVAEQHMTEQLVDDLQGHNIELDAQGELFKEKLAMREDELGKATLQIECMQSDLETAELKMLGVKETLDSELAKLAELAQASASDPKATVDQNVAVSAIDGDIADIDRMLDKVVDLPDYQPARPEEFLSLEQSPEWLKLDLLARDNEMGRLQEEIRQRDDQLDQLQMELTTLSGLVGESMGAAVRRSETRPNTVLSISELVDDSIIGPVEPEGLLATAPGAGDDLKHINGIGPKLEQSLNGLGIYFYRQLAELNAGEVEWLGEQLGAFHDRIHRDNWVAQADVLQLQNEDNQVVS